MPSPMLAGAPKKLDDVGKSWQYITFELSDQLYGVKITSIQEIRQWTKASVLPDQPYYGRGVLNIRGKVVPVYDLQVRLGNKIIDVIDSQVVLILSINGLSVGVLVDAVSDIISINASELRAVPDGPWTISNLAAHDNRMITLLDFHVLFASPIS